VVTAALSAGVILALRSAHDHAGAEGTPAPGTATPATAQGRLVRLRVTARPAGAVVSVDGAQVGASPYEADVTRDAAVHRITASAAGFEARTLDVRFDRDLQLDVALATATAPAVDAGPALVAGLATSPGTPSSTLPARPSKGPPRVVQAPSRPAPTRAIEEEDPFK
jgi:hypothetical protein